jgi:hypothetical protein
LLTLDSRSESSAHTAFISEQETDARAKLAKAKNEFNTEKQRAKSAIDNLKAFFPECVEPDGVSLKAEPPAPPLAGSNNLHILRRAALIVAVESANAKVQIAEKAVRELEHYIAELTYDVGSHGALVKRVDQKHVGIFYKFAFPRCSG